MVGKEHIRKILQIITFLCGLFWIIALTSDGKNKCYFSEHTFLLHYTLPSFNLAYLSNTFLINQPNLILLSFSFSWNLRINQSFVNIYRSQTGFNEKVIFFSFPQFEELQHFWPHKMFPGEHQVCPKHIIFTRKVAETSWAESCKSFCLVSILVRYEVPIQFWNPHPSN